MRAKTQNSLRDCAANFLGDNEVNRSSIHNTRTFAGSLPGMNMCRKSVWNALVCADLGFIGYQPKAGEQDRPEQIT